MIQITNSITQSKMVMRYVALTILFLGGITILPFQTQALTISPIKIQISGDPGKTIKGELTLFNEESNTKTFYSSAENFEARGETGAPFFVPGNEGLASWITVSKQAILKSKETETIPFSIQIPKGTEAGGYFAAILWGTTPPQAEGGGQVSVGGKLGVLILLNVSGQVKEGGGLLNFNTNGQRFFSALPVNLAYRFNNTGGDRVVPQGEIKIKNLFVFTSATLQANENRGSVLPGSIRKFEVPWENGQQVAGKKPGFFGMVGEEWSQFHFGWYTAELNLVWSTTNQTATATYSFFIIPWQLLIIIIVILTIIGFLSTRGLKKYNRWIIAQARRQQQ